MYITHEFPLANLPPTVGLWQNPAHTSWRTCSANLLLDTSLSTPSAD